MLPNFTDLKQELESTNFHRFELLRKIAQFAGESNYDYHARDLIIRLHDKRDDFQGYHSIIDSLLREAGLFNYIEIENLSIQDQIAYGAHLAPNILDSNPVVFHERQASVYHSLRSGNNVILSAPTSFGKSMIIEALLMMSDFNNVIIIVPTIALIDQFRRRLSHILGRQYKIITNKSQSLSLQNIFILTQERFLTFHNMPRPDFWVIDEFYKISGTHNNSRWESLNVAAYKLLKMESQFYLIGPNMGGLVNLFGKEIKYEVFIETLGTVSSNVIIKDQSDPYKETISLCLNCKEPTLVFCSSPKRASDLALSLYSNMQDTTNQEIIEFYEWCSENYSPEWHFSKALRKNIGLHHGKIPRSISQIAVEEFNRGNLDILICTSTLIEGVNTKAKNIIILDNKINNRKIDFFTYNNIKGRSGRMGYHSVGNVFLFTKPPEEELLEFEIPFITQDEQTPINILASLSQKDLTKSSLQRIIDFERRTGIPRKVLEDNISISEDILEKLYEYFSSDENFNRQKSLLSFINFPSYNQLENICEIMYTQMKILRYTSTGVKSYKQLAYLLNSYIQSDKNKTIKSISRQFHNSDDDSKIGNAISLKRNLLSFKIPQYIKAIESIFNITAKEKNHNEINLHLLLNLIHSDKISLLESLDEYGLPYEIAIKLPKKLLSKDLDYCLAEIKKLSLTSLDLTEFEKTILSDFQKEICFPE